MESYYHGKSSGLDPLVSFLNKPILIDNNHEIKTVDIPKQNSLLKGGIFLVDTKTTGETQPLVNWFLNEYESIDYQYKIQNQLIPLNNNSITNMLSGDFNSLLSNVKLISKFTLENFKPMIPNSVRNIWETGLGTNDYYLKLCGSGGGGMMLGFTNNIEDTTSKLRKLNTQMILLK
jgi:mevalonate kinase